MKIAVLSSPHSWYFNDLQAAARTDHEVVALPFTQLGAEMGSGSQVAAGETVLDGFDAVVVRTIATLRYAWCHKWIGVVAITLANRHPIAV